MPSLAKPTAEQVAVKKTGTYDRPVGSGGRKVLTKSTTFPVLSGHTQAHTGAAAGPDASKNADVDIEMVEGT